MSNFLTVKEAVERTGLSDSAIRRVIYPILKADKHPDRQLIEPNPAEARALRVKGENFAWKISEELLDREMQERVKKAKPEPKAGGVAFGGSDHLLAMIQMLQKELDIKNQQIESQTQLLKGFSERMHEGNVLIGSLQKQLTVGGLSRSSDTVDVASVPAAPQSAPASNEAAGSEVKPSTSKGKPKKHWLFRKIF